MEEKSRGRQVLLLHLQAVQSQCCRWELESETVRKGGSSLVLFSISLLKDLISWRNHMGLFIWTSVLLPLFFNSASRLLLFLSPMGGSLFSHLTSMPLLCLLMFSFKNKKMGWLRPLIKPLPTSSEILWLIFFFFGQTWSIFTCFWWIYSSPWLYLCCRAGHNYISCKLGWKRVEAAFKGFQVC